jgi:hypothetical protein
MQEQLRHLLRATELPNVTFQVIPSSTGAHPGLGGTFVILRFANSMTPDVVYIEGLVGQLCLDKKADLERYEQVFDHLRAVALSPRESIDRMVSVLDKEYA